MSLAALIRNMSAAGAPPEAIALAVEAIEAAEAKIAEGRAKAAARKRAERERARQSRDSHATVTDEPLSPAPSFPPDPHTNPTPIPARKNTRARGEYHPLPEDWQPDRPWPPELAAKLATWVPGEVEGQIRRMKNWAANAPPQKGKGLKADWFRFACNWLETHHDERRTSRQSNPQQNGLGKTGIAAERVREQIRTLRSAGAFASG